MNVTLMKQIDALVGQVAVRLLPQPATVEIPTSISRILLIRPGGIGDAVHLIPAIQQLLARFPSAQIDILAERRNQGVFSLCPAVSQVQCYDRPGDFLKVLGSSYDAVIDTEQWHRLSAVVARLVRSPVKIGFATNERQRMFTHTVAYSHDDYEMISFGNLLAPLGIGQTIRDGSPFLSVPSEADRVAADAVRPLADRTLVVIFPGASIVERQWGADRFGSLATLLTRMGLGVVVVGGAGERNAGQRITDGGRGINLAGQTSLAETAAIIKQSALVISGDSGILHLAVGLDIPTVALFGPGRARKWAPTGERHLVLNKELSCSPCTTFGTTPPCPHTARCMSEISVDEVFNAAAMLLTFTGAMASRCCKKDWIERK